LKDGEAVRWDDIKKQIADGVLKTLHQHTTNMEEDNILGRLIESPLDIERRNPAMKEGDMGHIGHFLSQSFSNRPVPGFGRYRTPVDRLYMCGASTHPGVGVNGGSGRAAAQVIMEDLGIEFKKVVAK
jgi:phytoene dehydrogenase-like protein